MSNSALQEKKIENEEEQHLSEKKNKKKKKKKRKEKNGATGKCLRLLSFSSILKITILKFQ